MPNGTNPNGAPNYAIHTDARDGQNPNRGSPTNFLLKFPGQSRQWTIEPEFGECGYRAISCCRRTVGNVLFTSISDLPTRAYQSDRACYEGNVVNTGLYCALKPCCRSGENDWPPYPPTPGLPLSMGAYCDLRNPDNCSGGLAFASEHAFAFSCWFHHACLPSIETCGDVPIIFPCAQKDFAPSVRPIEHGGSTTDQDVEPASVTTMNSRAGPYMGLANCQYEYAGVRYKAVDGSADATFWMCGNGQLGLNENPEYYDCAVDYDLSGDAMIVCGYTDHAQNN
jgi:hypothetical protein